MKPGNNRDGGKGALATRKQRSTLLQPANATPAGDERGDGQSGLPAQGPKPLYGSTMYSKKQIKGMVSHAVMGLPIIALGKYEIAALYYVFFAYVVLATPLLIRRSSR